MYSINKALLLVSAACCILSGCSQVPLGEFVDSLLENQFSRSMNYVGEAVKTCSAAQEEAVELRQKLAAQSVSVAADQDAVNALARESSRKFMELSRDYQNARSGVIDGVMKVLVEEGYADSTDDESVRAAVNIRIEDNLKKRTETRGWQRTM
jgi:pyruvate-formate lyase